MNGDNLLVTVAIPFYNAEEYIEDAIKSVLNQTHRNIELLLINDGSTDKSVIKAREYLEDKRVKLIDDGRNLGLVARLNQSVELAKGRYYARMDADDIMHPERIERQINFAEQHPEIDVIATAYYSIDSNNEIKGLFQYPDIVNPKDPRLLHPSVFAKTKWFEENRYDERFLRIEDVELWMRVGSKFNFYNIPESLMFYREFGIPNMKKYLITQKGWFKIYRNGSRYGLSAADIFKGYVRTSLKCAAWIVGTALGQQTRLIKARKRNELSFNLEGAKRILKTAINMQ